MPTTQVHGSTINRCELAIGLVKRGLWACCSAPLAFGVDPFMKLGGEAGGAGVHADLCDLGDHGHLASFGLRSWQGPGAKLTSA
jgi:hypothetical protein